MALWAASLASLLLVSVCVHFSSTCNLFALRYNFVAMLICTRFGVIWLHVHVMPYFEQELLICGFLRLDTYACLLWCTVTFKCVFLSLNVQQIFTMSVVSFFFDIDKKQGYLGFSHQKWWDSLVLCDIRKTRLSFVWHVRNTRLELCATCWVCGMEVNSMCAGPQWHPICKFKRGHVCRTSPVTKWFIFWEAIASTVGYWHSMKVFDFVFVLLLSFTSLLRSNG